ncbi:hypothetical protein CRENBAI_017073 [Crenichthys baileyi]|uniref:Uncharacterized protein n=1 Tax=Crenichthys baileyi TaxID=28760 RepID=A0AAV9R8J4_9TELE
MFIALSTPVVGDEVSKTWWIGRGTALKSVPLVPCNFILDPSLISDYETSIPSTSGRPPGDVRYGVVGGDVMSRSRAQVCVVCGWLSLTSTNKVRQAGTATAVDHQD